MADWPILNETRVSDRTPYDWIVNTNQKKKIEEIHIPIVVNNTTYSGLDTRHGV